MGIEPTSEAWEASSPKNNSSRVVTLANCYFAFLRISVLLRILRGAISSFFSSTLASSSGCSPRVERLVES